MKETCKTLMNSFREDVLSDSHGKTNSLLDLVCNCLITAEINLQNIITKELCKYENKNVIYYDDFDVLLWILLVEYKQNKISVNTEIHVVTL